MADEPYVAVGRVIKTHGLKGEVSVVSDIEASLALLVGQVVWFVPPPRSIRSARLLSVRPGPKGPLVTFEGVGSVDQAAQLAGCQVLVATEGLPDDWAPEQPRDFAGYSVSDAAYGDLGTVGETIVTGANDVWVVSGPRGEVLIPVIDDVVVEIDEQSRTIRVSVLPGLIDEAPS